MTTISRNNIILYFRKGYKPILYLIILVSFVLLSCETKKTYNLKEIHQKYMTASINHDIETLEKMTHDSIVWILGPYTLKGKEAALGPNKYDKGTGAKLEYTNVTIRQDTVEFELLERNDILTAMNMESVKIYPRFIFKNGLLYKKEIWKPSPDIPIMIQRSQPRMNWIKKNHPEIFQEFFDSERNFIFNEENGVLQIQMAKEWEKSKQSKKVVCPNNGRKYLLTNFIKPAHNNSCCLWLGLTHYGIKLGSYARAFSTSLIKSSTFLIPTEHLTSE